MFFNRPENKWRAKEQIRRSRPEAWKVTLLYLLLTTVVSSLVQTVVGSPLMEVSDLLIQGYEVHQIYRYVFRSNLTLVALFLNILLSFFVMVLSFGYAGYTLHLSRSERAGYACLIDGFSMAGRVIALNLLMTLFTFLWSLLFLIPGILAALRYSQAVYCLLDDPSIGPLEAIRRSKQLMQGRKLEQFTLQLSFFGWALLGGLLQSAVQLLFRHDPEVGYWIAVLAGCVFNLWLTPYRNVTLARFYNFLIGYPEQPPVEPGMPGGGSNGDQSPRQEPPHDEPPKQEPRSPKLEF